MSRLRWIHTVRRAVAVTAVGAGVASMLVACTGSAASSSGTVTGVSFVSPASDGVVAAIGSVPLRVHVAGKPSSVTVLTGDRTVQLAKSGSDWASSIPAATWLTAGKNNLRVSAVGAKKSASSAIRVVYRASTATNLGLQATALDADGQAGVKISSTTLVAGVTATLNGHDLTSRIRLGKLNQTIYLGGDEGLKPGENTFAITAVDASGGYQAATVSLTVADEAPIAAATTEPGPAATVATGGAAQDAPRVRIGQTVALDGTQSQPTKKGAGLSYAWSVAQAPAGAKPTITNADKAKASFTPDVAGNYLLKLTVKQDGLSATSSDVTQVLTLANVPPIGDVIETQAPGGIYFDGSVVPAAPGQPLELLLIDRNTVERQAFSGGTTAASVAAFTNDIKTFATQATKNELVEVLSAPSGYQCTSIAGACAAFESLLQYLGVDSTQSPSQNDATIHAGLPFSTITVTSGADTSVWRTSATPAFAAPLLPGVTVGAGNLGGHLAYPLGLEPLLFTPDTAQSFTTSASNTSTTNVMKFGSCQTFISLPAPPGLPQCQTFTSGSLTTCGNGPTGGFQVVVLWAASLAPIDNKTFTTNSGCGADGIDNDAAQLAAMLANVAPYVSSGGTKDYLVAVQSIGSPRAQTSSAAVNAAWTAFGTGAIVPLGGVGSTFDYLGYQSGYALMGYSDTTLPGFGAPYAAQASSDTPHAGKTPLPAVLNGVLARNQRNDYVPQTYGPIAGPTQDGLSAIATRPETAWPVENTPGELAAWHYFTDQIIAANGITNWPVLAGNCQGLDHGSIRGAYCNSNVTTNLTVIPRDKDYQPGQRFTQDDWNAVIAEFTKEKGEVGRVAGVLTDLEAPFASGSNVSSALFNTLTTSIANELKTPTTTPIPSVWSFWLGIFGDLTSVVAGFVGAGEGLAAAGAFINGLSQAFNVSSQTVGASGTSSQNLASQKIQGDWTDIEAGVQTNYQTALAGLVGLEPLLVTDYGRLSEASNIDVTALTQDNLLFGTTRATNAWATPLLISAAYQPDALVSAGGAVNSGYSYGDGPYVGDANNFSCYYGDGDHGLQTFAPFGNTAPNGDYLAGSPAQRYVLATPQNPSDKNMVPREKITPDQPPASVLATLFTPPSGATDVTHLGLSVAEVYEHDFGLTTGQTVTCPTSPGLPTGALAAASPGGGQLNLFYTFEQEGSSTASLYNDYIETTSGVWNGPGPLPGTPDIPSYKDNGQQNAPLAAVGSSGEMHLFFLQKGKLVNDYNIGPAGWQGPGELAGKPNSADEGGGLAAVTTSSGITDVFFWQGTDLVYDEQANGQWSNAPLVAVSNGIPGTNSGTPLAAVSTGPNAVTVYYVTGNGSSANILAASRNGTTWSAPTTIVSTIDPETPLAATTDGSGHPTVFYTNGGDNEPTTTLMSSTNFGAGWVAATVATGENSPTPSVAATTALPNGMTAFAFPHDGYAHSPISTFGWDPVSHWTPGAIAPVPWIVGDFPG